MIGKFLNRFLSPFQSPSQNGFSPMGWLNPKSMSAPNGNPFFDMNQMNEFVQNAISQTLETQEMYGNFKTSETKSKSLGKNGPITYEVFELQHSIIVKIDVPTQVACQNLQISLQGSKLLVTERNHMFQVKIQLPCAPKTNGIEAKYYDETIEICLLKRNDETCTEIDIQF